MSEGFSAPPPPPSGPPPARVRPATVTAASWLLVIVAVIAAVYLIASVSAISDYNAAFEEAFAGTESEDFAGVAAIIAAIFTGGLYLLVAVTLAILAIFNNQGRNPARIVTWIVGGLGVCCGGLNLVGTALGDVTANMGGTEGAPDSEEMERILTEHLPSWLEPTLLTGNVLGVLVAAAALVLLALPPSNEFFRKPREPFEPPAPGYPPPPGPPPVG